ncbi:MAG TPA: DEAD/DEAH box helicase, partial [Actinomycetota bacterium]|nr:DEAD/DEAH box helicase [Actinomycetota bacterium]
AAGGRDPLRGRLTVTDRTELQGLLESVSATLESEGLKALVPLPPKPGTKVRPEPPLPRELRARLSARGIDGLWTHQAEALAAVRRGENVAVSTGTASGKSLCFNLPTIESILADRRTRALYLYPTKALAQDQLRALRAFGLTEVLPATYDGDTPSDERPSVRRYANIVLTNPDMLHFGILPSHPRWADFLANLRYVVIDEGHVCRGVFGSHVGCILRRLRRLAAGYGANPLFILTSATIPNPGGLAERLVGLPFTEVTEDGAPRGERLFAFWNPPFLEEKTATRASANWESARLMAAFAGRDIKTIAFAKSRKAAELVAKYARTLAGDAGDRITAYRAGYLASDRRAIEQRLFAGELLGVAATTALELGIDVGGLDAVVMNGFPGTVAQVWQQAGRAGRSTTPSVAVLVGRDDPLDQYYIAHPETMLSRPFEMALVDTANPNILKPHLACAAYEKPVPPDEVAEYFGPDALRQAEEMAEEGRLALRKSKGVRRYHYRGDTPPGDLDLRSMGVTYAIVERQTGALLGTVDGGKAFSQVHPGAVYLHQGDNWEVAELDLANNVALVEPSQGRYFTQSRETSDIRVLEATEHKRVGRAEFYLGRVEVTNRVVAFARKDIATGETLAIVDLDLPETVLSTVAVWYTVDPSVVHRARLGAVDLPGSLHAAEHAAIGMLPLFAMADRWDIGGVSTALSADTGLPTVFIYDGHPGGAGIAARGYAEAPEHLGATLEAVSRCPCESGCPSCVQSPKCGNGNEPLDKAGAIRLLATILGSDGS